MSDDLNKKIKQITDLLSQDGAPDNLKGLLSLLSNSGGGQESAHRTEEPSFREERHEKSEIEENLEMFRKAKKIMETVNTNNDPRVNLLTAIRPFLNSTRQKKIGSCIKFIQMSRLTKYIDDGSKSDF